MMSMVQGQHDDYANPRVDALSASAALKDLIRHTLAYEPEARPTAGALATQLEDLADDTSGGNLRLWARNRHWPAAASFDAELVGRTITAGRPVSSSLLYSGTTPIPATLAPDVTGLP